MAGTVPMQCESAVTEMSQNAFGGSSSENGTTMIPFDRRQLDLQRALGTTSPLCWRQTPYHVDMHARSTCYHPIPSRFIVAQGSSLNDQNQRIDFPPDLTGVSTSQPMSQSMLRLSCSLAVVCGVSLRHMALLLASLFLIPLTQSSMQRWMDDIGSHRPPPEEMLQPWLALTPATKCPSDGYYPLGTDHGVMVVQEEHARILLTHAAESEHGADARTLLEKWPALGLHVPAALSDDSHSFTEAIKAVSPPARLQADHCPTVKQSWGPLKTSLFSSRRTIKASGKAKQEKACMALAKKWWTLRWSLLKKPGTLSVEDKQAMTELESEDEGLVPSFRSMLRQLVPIFDHAHSEAQAQRRRQQLRKDIQAREDHQLEKIPPCFDDPWEQALRYLRKKGMGKYRRGSNAESGMRLLRRLEKHHDGIKSAATRQHYMQISQAIKYLSLDVADFLEQGPQIAVLPGV